MEIDKDDANAMNNLGSYYQVNDLFVEKIIDYHQHNNRRPC